MTEPLQSLWPEDVDVEDVLTPLAILRFQADELKRRTNGRLKAEIETIIDGSQTKHSFDIIAPMLDNYRYRLFHVEHDAGRVYPAFVVSNEFVVSNGFDEIDGGRWAYMQSDFAHSIGTVLQSDQTRSLIHSLLARIGEASRSATVEP